MKLIPLFQRLHSGECNSRIIKVELESAYSDKRVKLCFVTPMGKIYITEELEMTDNACEYSIPRLLLDGRGVLLTQLIVFENEDYIIKSPIEEYPVFASVDDMSFPGVSEASLKSLTEIIDELTEKSDITHTHDERYYTEEEVMDFLSGKSDTDHTHLFSEIKNKPGDVKYSNVIVAFDSLPAPVLALKSGGYVVDFHHNVKNVPVDSEIKLRYKKAGSAEEKEWNIRYLSDTVPVGEIFIAANTTVGFSEFFSSGFPEAAGDDAFIIYVKSDGTGQIITKSRITGSKIILTGEDTVCETWVTLPSDAVEHVSEVKSNEKRLITSEGVYNALSTHNTQETSHQDMRALLSDLDSRLNSTSPTKVSQLTNDSGFVTAQEVELKLSGYSKTDEAQSHTSDSITAHNSDFSAHPDVRELIQKLSDSINTVSDTVIETGTSGKCTYRKWASGIAECWGVVSFSAKQITSLPIGITEVQGIFTVPSIFTGIKCAHVSPYHYYDLGGRALARSGSLDLDVGANLITSQISDFAVGDELHINISIKGFWK